MKFLLRVVPALLLAVAVAGVAAAQTPATSWGGGGGLAPASLPPEVGTDLAGELDARQAELAQLRARQASLKAADDDQKKQIELLQKQVETLEKMIRLLADQLKKQPAGTDVEKVQVQVATLQARSVQAARRDQELAGAVDDLQEQVDAKERYDPWLPAPLKELFLPSQTDQSPLSINGVISESYQEFNARPGRFSTPDFSPYFLLQLNDRFLLEVNLDLTNGGTVFIGQMQMDWFINDYLTFVIGRYLTPIGFFNERLNHEWINKLPDVPVMFQQVSPVSSTDGVQLRGSTYLFNSPVKLEYSLYGGNGFELATSAVGGGLRPVADLGALATTDVVAAKAIGGRIGIWIPEIGVNFGASTYLQNGYSPGDKGHLELWGLDASYHLGNWDARLEYAEVFQQATAFIGNDIRRMGLYAQLAYRPQDASNRYLRNLEFVGRYSMERFGGIDATQLDLTTFSDPRTFPVNQDQWTFGINYYVTPGMVFKFAYEINRALDPVNANNNAFLAEFAWGF